MYISCAIIIGCDVSLNLNMIKFNHYYRKLIRGGQSLNRGGQAIRLLQKVTINPALTEAGTINARLG